MMIRVKVKPNARKDALDGPDAEGLYRAEVKATPVDGKANTALVALIAEHFDVPRGRVSIRSGAGARLKLIQIDSTS